jgi:DNA-binding SARP family transcriptional activator
VRLLGALDVEGIDGRALGSRKARTLIKVLALARGRPVGPDRIADVLWPDGDAPARPADQIGVLVSRLRSTLGPDRLARTDGGWALRTDWLDMAELEARVEEAGARLAAGSPGAARAAARAALTLLRGELLADEPDPVWADAERAAVARLAARARLVAAEAALVSGDPAEAAVAAEGALDHDPYDEAALRVLMRAHTAAGRPASALAAYARLRERLAEDLGVDPVRETEDLHTAILLGRPVVEAGSGPVPATGIVGRDEPLAALDRALDRTALGRAATLMVVEGEAGIGKTALVSAWAGPRAGGVLLLAGRCDEMGRDLPLQPLLDGLDAHLRTLGPAETATVLGDAGPVLGPLLGRFSAGADQAGPTTVADPAAGQARLFSSLLAAIERAADGRTAVIVVEDIHLAGASTVEWLRFAVRRGRRLLIIATMRPEGPAISGADRLRLGPLDRESVAVLVGPDRAADLHERSGGHPLFLLELASAAPGELPASVRDAVAGRVEAMGEAAATLRTAAVLGAEVDVDLIAGVLDLAVTALLGHLEAGIRRLVVEERAGALRFRHELVREALVADTTLARRAFVHREAARVLRSRPGHDPMQVAWHARLGGDADTAVTALVDAAATAASRYDVPLAEELLTGAIALVDTPAARLARARVRIARLDRDGAEADGLAALELGAGAEALEVAGWAAYYRRDFELALRRAEEAAAQTADRGVRASCLTMGGRILHASGRLAEAEPRLREAVTGGPAGVRQVAQVFLAGLCVHRGAVEEGHDFVERALLDPTKLAHPFAIHHGYLFAGLALGMLGRPVEALATIGAGREAAARGGEAGLRFLAVQDNLRSWVLRHLGRTGESDDCTAAALALCGEHPDTMLEMDYAARMDRIEGRLLVGDFDGAADRLAAASGIVDWYGGHSWHHQQRFGVLSARLALEGGEPDRAAEAADAVIADSDRRGTARYRALATVLVARARLAAGGTVDHDALEAALARLDRVAGLEAWRVTAELAAAAGADRWWRDAERRAGALVAHAGDHAETLRRCVGSTFAALGRS